VCCSCRAAQVLLRAIRKRCRQEHGSATWRLIHSGLPRGPLKAVADVATEACSPIAGMSLRQIYLMRGSPVRLFPW